MYSVHNSLLFDSSSRNEPKLWISPNEEPITEAGRFICAFLL